MHHTYVVTGSKRMDEHEKEERRKKNSILIDGRTCNLVGRRQKAVGSGQWAIRNTEVGSTVQ